MGGESTQQDPMENSPHPPNCAPLRPAIPSSLDSSLEKTILGFFFLTRCWVFGCRRAVRAVRAVRRGSGVTKSLSEAAEARCWCLETRKGRSMSVKEKKKNLSERRAGPVSPPMGRPHIPEDCFLAAGVFWLSPWPISSSSIASNPLV